MNDITPKVSVLVPTYNRSLLIQKTVASILAQTFQDFEIIITDNCSTDETEKVICAIDDSRIVYVRNNVNIGPVNNYNKALRLARGEFVYIFSDDDIMLPETLTSAVQAMEENPGVGLVHFNISIINENDDIVDTHWASRIPAMSDVWREIVSSPLMNKNRAFNFLYYRWNFVSMPAVLLRNELLIKNGIEFNNQLRYLCDYDLWLRVSAFGDFYFIDKPYVLYRIHTNNDARTLNSRVYFRELVISKLGFINLYNRTELHGDNHIQKVASLARKQLVYGAVNETFFEGKIRKIKTYLKNNLSESSLEWLKTKAKK